MYLSIIEKALEFMLKITLCFLCKNLFKSF
jgi:hypothetical protein